MALDTAVEHDAREVAAAGRTDPASELEASRATFAGLLSDGLATPGAELLSAFADDTEVGLLWLAERSAVSRFVYDVVVHEDHRGRGLGRAVMLASASWCRARGSLVLGLDVFGPTVVARRLYDSLGYQVVEDVWRTEW